jgi:hypothetical protein
MISSYCKMLHVLQRKAQINLLQCSFMKEFIDLIFPWMKWFFFFFWWDWSLNSQLCACTAWTTPPVLWLLWRWGLMNCLPACPWTVVLLISVSQVARITGVSYWHLACSDLSCDWLHQSYPWLIKTTHSSVHKILS